MGHEGFFRAQFEHALESGEVRTSFPDGGSSMEELAIYLLYVFEGVSWSGKPIADGGVVLVYLVGG